MKGIYTYIGWHMKNIAAGAGLCIMIILRREIELRNNFGIGLTDMVCFLQLLLGIS